MHPPLPPPWHRLRHATLGRLLPRFARECPPSLVLRRIATTDATNPAPADVPKLALSPGSRHHNSLASFLEYVQRSGRQINRTTYVGTHYEYATAIAFKRFGMHLIRVGRRDDDGIDLIGHWIMTPLREPMPVIVQCKSRIGSLGPSHVRELEGSFESTPAEWRNKHVLGILATSARATKGTLETMSRSRRPLAFAMVSRKGIVQQFVWNRAASEHGLEGVGVTARYTPLPPALRPIRKYKRRQTDPANPKKSSYKPVPPITEVIKDIQLTWMGSPIFPERQLPPLEPVDLLGFEALKIPPNPPVQFLVPKPCGGQFEHTADNGADAEPKIERRGRPRATHNSHRLCYKARAWKMVYSGWEVKEPLRRKVGVVKTTIGSKPEALQPPSEVEKVKTAIENEPEVKKPVSEVEAITAIIHNKPEVKKTQAKIGTAKTTAKRPASRAKAVKVKADDDPEVEQPESKAKAAKATVKRPTSRAKAVKTNVETTTKQAAAKPKAVKITTKKPVVKSKAVKTTAKKSVAKPKAVKKTTIDSELEVKRPQKKAKTVKTTVSKYIVPTLSDFIHGELGNKPRLPVKNQRQQRLEADAKLVVSMTSIVKRRALIKQIAAEKAEGDADKG